MKGDKMIIKIKITNFATSLAHPQAEVGYNGNCTINEVRDVPTDVPAGEVLRQWQKVTCSPLRTSSIPWNAIAGKPLGAIVRLQS